MNILKKYLTISFQSPRDDADGGGGHNSGGGGGGGGSGGGGGGGGGTKTPVDNSPASANPSFAKTAEGRAKEFSDMFEEVRAGQMIYTKQFWNDLAWACARTDKNGKEEKASTVNPEYFVNFLVAAYGLDRRTAEDVYHRAAVAANQDAPRIAAEQGLLVPTANIGLFTAALKADPVVGDVGSKAGNVANGPAGPNSPASMAGEIDPKTGRYKYEYWAAEMGLPGTNSYGSANSQNTYISPSIYNTGAYGYTPYGGGGGYGYGAPSYAGGYGSGGYGGGFDPGPRGGGGVLGTILSVFDSFSRGGGGGYGGGGYGPGGYGTPPYYDRGGGGWGRV